MKKISIILMMLIAVSAFSQQNNIAQKQNSEKGKMVKMSPQERATIASKRMALALDLTEAQRLEIEKIQLQRAQEQQKLMAEKQKIRKENRAKRYSKTNANLDKQLAHQEKMRSVLTEEQYSKWKKSQDRRPAKKKMSMKKRNI